MLRASEKIHSHNDCEHQFVVSLTYDQRQKSRLKVETKCGKALGIVLERGQQLYDGDYLVTEDGQRIKVVCQPELVVNVTANSELDLIRAAYHLGNRHVPVQITTSWLRLAPDHVLEEMLTGLGLSTTREEAPFQPENGAYHSAHHGHHHHHD